MKKFPLFLFSLFLFSLIIQCSPQRKIQENKSIESSNKIIDKTKFEILLQDDQKIELAFYADNIFRWFWDLEGGGFQNPKAEPPATILIPNAKPKAVVTKFNDDEKSFIAETNKIRVEFDKIQKLLRVTNLETNKIVIEEVSPAELNSESIKLSLNHHPDEYFYGGGVQNGRFSHKGKKINIVNENSWTDGGVASPKPFYWSTGGYGVMFHTFKPGKYDFGSNNENRVILEHKTNYLDVFFMISSSPKALLQDYYQLTGEPVLIPKFGFYQGHLNAYNRDYWAENPNGILFEDGKRYKESQTNKEGIKESLNGELNNYQFSARAVIDRYANYDMPLGWILPNDGYGAGYGQTKTLAGNVENLKQFGDYARDKGVEIGLWTQSDLHPIDSLDALLQRDIAAEIRDAGVRVLKTDVAWVGAGYSFGLNGIQEVAKIMPNEGNNARPFIISLDGWAGTQHYAGIWSGDQTGGEWEYIRFHIPTYIGSGLSGQPNITSDMDGIFGGKKPIINVRDFQWKTFTPMQLNMDGWGSNPKYPHIMGEPYTSINRNYLKFKSEIMPYTYSIAYEAVKGLPMIRPMFVASINDYTLGSATKYQYLYGPNFLVAPIYQNTQSDEEGNDIRNGIYLPAGEWIDYYTGEVYEGNKIINNFETPLWKLPVFVKNGAIIPKANPNNNPNQINQNLRIFEVYPGPTSEFVLYDDDGYTEAYKNNEHAKTRIESFANQNMANIKINPTEGIFKGFKKNKKTEIQVNVSTEPTSVLAQINNNKIDLKKVRNLEDFENAENAYLYVEKPDFNQFSTEGSSFAKTEIIRNPQIRIKLKEVDITNTTIDVLVEGFKFEIKNSWLSKSGSLKAPTNIHINEDSKSAYTLEPEWSTVSNADYYEIEWDNMLYSTIKNNHLLFEDLKPETKYDFKIRAVNKSGKSSWAKASGKTNADPFQFAIKGITGEISVPTQKGEELRNLFDFEETALMHTKYDIKATPFELLIDLNSFNDLEKLVYIPRTNGYNGVFLEGTIAYSEDNKNWSDPIDFHWSLKNNDKIFEFKNSPTARFIKINVTKAVGDFGSGKEIYVFKVPGTESYLPGDINNDKKIDENDLTSYLNYTGLKQGDADFEGYVSRGDVNRNGLIDALDISYVTTKLDGGIDQAKRKVEGTLELNSSKKSYSEGEIIEVILSGKSLENVNAFSLAMPYDASKLEYISHEAIGTNKMLDMTKTRLHTNGDQVLYPTFSNIGNKPLLNGNLSLVKIQFKAKKNIELELNSENAMIVSPNLNVVEQ